MRRLAVILISALSLAGCARALKEPPALADLGGGAGRHAPEEVDDLLKKGSVLYAERTLEGVREAAGVFLAAARADTRRIDGLMEAVRAQVWLADHETDPERRVLSATGAVQAAQWCGRIAPSRPPCDYWLGAALGVQARERRSTALDALPKIVEAFQRAAAGEPGFDEGGPDRALSLLYARAPGWPTGPGDPDLALVHARKAVDLKPDYPPNHLALAEALAAVGETSASLEAYRRALDMARRSAESGDPDAPEWVREAEEALARANANS